MIGDAVRDEDAAGAADEFGRDVVADRQDEDEDRAGADAGDRLGEIDPPEGRPVVRAHGFGGAQIARRDRLHHRIERQDHERQKDVRHRDDRAGRVVDHHQTVVVGDESDPDEQVVDHALLLQEDLPGRGADQKRRPERQKDEDQDEVGRPHRQVAQKPGDRIAEDQTGGRYRDRQDEGSHEQFEIDLLVLGLQLRAFGGRLHVHGGQKIAGCVGSGIILDGAPDIDVAPLVVDVEELLSVGDVRVHVFDPTAALAEERRDAGILVVQARSEARVDLLLHGDQHVVVKRREDLLGGRLAALRIPGLEQGDRFGDRVADYLVLDGAEQHVRDRKDEGDEDENEQRRHEQERPDLLRAQRAAEAFLERLAVKVEKGTVAGARIFGRVGHSSSPRSSVSRRDRSPAASSDHAYCVSQTWNRASRSSRLSAHQK